MKVVLFLFVLAMLFGACDNKLQRHFAWTDCLRNSCNTKCKEDKTMGGNLVWYDDRAQVISCECYLRDGNKYFRFTFDEIDCGPKPR